jgi:hypothetical protein
MNAIDRTRDAVFVERLHARTLAKGLAWGQTAHEGRYQVNVGEFVVEIGDGAGEADHGELEILVCQPDGRALEVLTAALLPEAVGDHAISRNRQFAETYEVARRMALGVDQVIEKLIETLL